jgi:predicted metal-binding membrane protein
MPARGPLAVQRAGVLGLLLAMAGGAWAWLIWLGPGGMAMGSPTMGLGAPLFVLVWAVMMVAMMFPAAAPMILTFQAVQAGRRRRGDGFIATWVFVAGYMLVWVGAGVVAYGAALGAEALAARAGISAAGAARVGGFLLVLAGLYQLTPLKDRCLAQCRTPMGFVVTAWRDGAGGALRMGVQHGLYCLGCCWLLFAIMFPLGVMNLAAMAAITLVVAAEKSLPWVRPVASGVAVALVAYGLLVLVLPRALPTYMAADMAVPMAPAGR